MRSRYGSSPQIDLDKQIARTRVAEPLTLDFQLIARRVRENNMGVGGIYVESDVTVNDGQVTFATGQKVPLEGAAEASGWQRFSVLDYDTPAKTRLTAAPLLPVTPTVPTGAATP